MPRRARSMPALLLLAAVAIAGPRPAAAAEFFVLAVSWQPAFCETRPAKPECETQSEDRFDASHFALHGLWPQPRRNVYCGVEPELRAADRAGRWQALPAPAVSPGTRAVLERVMPGTRSSLDRHEWIKHGTCYGAGAEDYFADAVRLLAELNRSPVRELFASGIGAVLSADDIRAAFDEAFGEGAGLRVHVACRRAGARRLIVELTVNLAGPIDEARGVGDLIRQAPVNFVGCPAGIVDRVGTGLADR